MPHALDSDREAAPHALAVGSVESPAFPQADAVGEVGFTEAVGSSGCGTSVVTLFFLKLGNANLALALIPLASV